MLRSLYSGISGLHAHQQMMDVTGNNIANVNTIGFKSSQTIFEDTLSQLTGAAGAPQNGNSGTNPAQVGLGVRVAANVTSFAQGAAQTTGKTSDMMIQGDGFFIVRNGPETQYTRAGSFTVDAQGTLTTPNGFAVQGWAAVDGVVNTAGVPTKLTLPLGGSLAPVATSNVTMTGNLSNEAVIGATYDIPFRVYDSTGAASTITAHLEKTATDTYSMTLPDGSSTTITFTAGKGPASVVCGAYNFDTHDMTQFSGADVARVADADGSSAGTLSSLTYTVSDRGEVIGVFSNGLKQKLGQVALATFRNVNGLEKAGDSTFRATANSGLAQVGEAGTSGLGSIVNGALEMSNVDLAQEFTNLVVAQRGFQANSRIITTSDEILQELVSIKR
jgi:flagellar hook protein FlgE